MFSNMKIKEHQGQIDRNVKQLENCKNLSCAERQELIQFNESLQVKINTHKYNPISSDPNAKINPAKIKVILEPKKDLVIKSDPLFVSENTLNNHYKKFISINNTLPEYIYQNLKKWPNNKGYIWKDISYYGERPSESKILYMIEPQRGFEYLHEIHPNKHILKMKRGRVITVINE